MSNKNIQDIYPLSPMQQGMLFHTLYSPEAGMYLDQLSIKMYVRGDFKVYNFQQAWQQVVDLHPVLRTAFSWEGREKPLQLVFRLVKVPLEQQDWRGLSLTEQKHRLSTFLQSDRNRGFQLSKPPLMRLTLIQLADDTYQLIFSYQHILLDAWSVALVFKDVLTLYEAFCQKQNLQIECPRPYRDYITWLRQHDMSKTETFWRQALKGFTTPTSLGKVKNFRNLADDKGNHDTRQIQLSQATTTALHSFAKQHHLTLNTIVQGAWALLLSCYSGEKDVIFGATVSGRPVDLVGVESMVGVFINTLPVRVQIHPDDSLVSWLKQLQIQQLELRQHEHSPLVQIQGWSEVPRGMPLFESILVFENVPVDDSLAEEGGSLEIRDCDYMFKANYPLTVMVLPEEQLSLQINYDCEYFDTATISQVLEFFHKLLEGMIVNPNQPLKDLSLLPQTQLDKLLVEWNHTQTDYPQDLCIHQIFEAQVEKTPDAIALVSAGEKLSYRELNRRANQLGHHLQTLGVGPEVLVGICIQRSLELIIGLLGILKAGGAYLPLDPEYPQHRLAFMLQDAQAPILLTQKTLREQLPEHNAHVVYLDTDSEIIQQKSEENLVSDAIAQSLAYVMYTSGSTGRPKGVTVIHRGVVRLVKETNYADFSAEEVFLQLAPISFDASTLEIWGSLLNGARLGILPPGTPSLEELGNSIVKFHVTTLWLTAGLFHLMVDERLEDLKPLRQLLAGGDVLSVTHVQKFLQQVKHCKLINGYGPTENTTFSCCYQITDLAQIDFSVPIGRPIANTQVYILDPYLQPVPIGAPGELYVGGAGLARGYLNHPDLTSERFIPNPFSNQPHQRLYKTGDLACYLPDGNIKFLGRVDNQVKIRGFRIEVGEIESVLDQHVAVREVVVTVREDVPGNKRLVAYVVLKQAQSLTSFELLHFLKEQLPEYMIPSAIVFLETLPLTANGKVDRSALPTPDDTTYKLQTSIVAPRDTWEFQLLQIWEDVLQIRPIGVKDNFFDLGGHSLLAVRLMDRIHKQFGQNLPLSALFPAATVEQLANMLRQKTETLTRSPLIGIQPSGSKRPFFCVHPALGTVLCYSNLARYLGQDQPFYALEAAGLHGDRQPFTRIEDMAAYYIEALRAVQAEGPYLLGGWSMGGLIAFEMAQQLRAQGQQVALLALLDISAGITAKQDLSISDDAAMLVYIFGDIIPLKEDHLHKLTSDEQLAYILEQAIIANLVPPDSQLHQFRAFIETYKAGVKALQNYTPQVYPGQVTLFKASEVFAGISQSPTLEELIAESLQDPAMGWQELATQGVEMQMVSGNHYTMVEPPHVQGLAEKLKTYIDQASAVKL